MWWLSVDINKFWLPISYNVNWASIGLPKKDKILMDNLWLFSKFSLRVQL